MDIELSPTGPLNLNYLKTNFRNNFKKNFFFCIIIVVFFSFTCYFNNCYVDKVFK